MWKAQRGKCVKRHRDLQESAKENMSGSRWVRGKRGRDIKVRG